MNSQTMKNVKFCLSTIICLSALYSVQASSIFRPKTCPICTAEDLLKCPVLEEGPGCEVIPEPNCGCCKMCAKKEGENCGVATGLCETGLECIPPPISDEQYRDYGLANYFMEVVMGEFICVTRQHFLDILNGNAYEEDNVLGNDHLTIPDLEEFSQNYDALANPDYGSQTGKGDDSNLEIPALQDLGHLNPFKPESSEGMGKTERPAKPEKAPFQNSKEPCIYHADTVWGKEHFDHHEWIPSCEKDGSYYPEQCELSFGLERGRCWCVDKIGNPMSKFMPGDMTPLPCSDLEKYPDMQPESK